MNRILFNLKTAGLVVLGLFLMVGVATLTFGFAGVKESSPKVLTIYYQHADGLYSTIQPTNSCTVVSITPCTISYDNYPGVDEFVYSDRPLEPRTESSSLTKGTN